VLLLWTTSVSYAQKNVVVHLRTNDSGAILFADSLRLGSAQRGMFEIPSTTRRLRLIASGENAWSITPLERILEASDGDTVEVDLFFPYYHSFETIPYGAHVFLQSTTQKEFLGKTPLLYTTEKLPSGHFSVELQGYTPVPFIAGRDVWNRYSTVLQKLHSDANTDIDMVLSSSRRSYRWIDYSAALLALAGGIFTVYYKFEADNIDDEYQRSGDPSLRHRIDRLDNQAAISLGLMQAGLVTLSVRFILR